MAQTNFTPILLYSSSTPGNAPLAANLTNSTNGAEIAINIADKNLFFKDSGGTVNIVPIRQSSTSSNGWLSSTDWNTFNNKGSGTVTSVSGTTGRITSTGGATPIIDLASGVATAGTTGSSTLIPVVTIDTYGRVTSITTASNPQGTVTSVTGTAPVVSSGGATPAISMAAATNSVNGYLTSTDWTTFNNKGSGTVTSVAALTLGTTGTDLSSTVATGTTTPVITLNVPTASATNRGVLSSADWTTFNGKGSGSVTSVAATVPAFLSIAGSPITTSGTLAITLSGTALPVANGGTGLTTLTANYIPYGNGTSAFSSSSTFTFDGSKQIVPAIRINTTGVLVNSQETLSVVCSGSAGPAATFQNSAGAASNCIEVWNTATTGNNLFTDFVTEPGYSPRGSISYNRTAGLVSYNTTSDIRLKTNIQPVVLGAYGSIIDSIPIVSYNWKETNYPVRAGVIAQIVESIIPECVNPGDSEDTIKQTWGVDMSAVIPMLINEIQSLRARLAAANIA
jgi:hypothetical protein